MLPIVSPEATRLPVVVAPTVTIVPQNNAAPPQPLKSSKPGLVKLAPIFLMVIEGEVDEATNLYHTSYFTVPPQVVVVLVTVALATVSPVKQEAVVSKVALAQRSFPGAA